MGRESRQARRARERRLQERQRQGQSNFIKDNRWSILVGAGVVAIVVIVLIAQSLTGPSVSSSDPSAVATAQAKSQYTPVPGLVAGPAKCTYNEMVAPGFYHVHSALRIYHNGVQQTIPANLGFALDSDCLYWVHTHSPSYGIIHIESPYTIKPTLADFFKIWKQPLTPTRVWKYRVSPGQMRVYVDGKPYTGNPARITLGMHVDVVMEIGGPFHQPTKFPFSKYQV